LECKARYQQLAAGIGPNSIRAYLDARAAIANEIASLSAEEIAAVDEMGTCRGRSHRFRKKRPFYKGF
jgi:hypothetical protein